MRDRVKFYGKRDMVNGFMLTKALIVLKQLTQNKEYEDINDVIELYNVDKFIQAQIFRVDFKPEDKALFNKDNEKIIKQHLGRFFTKFDENILAEFEEKLDREYIEDFLEVFEKYKIYKKISWDAFKKFICSNHIPTFCILEREKIVNAYEYEIKELILQDDQSINILIDKYLKKASTREVFLPKCLSVEDKEQIVLIVLGDFSPQGNFRYCGIFTAPTNL